MTGMTSSIIHSGRLPLIRKASTTLSRLESFFRLASELVSRASRRSSSESLCTSMLFSISRTASPPIPAWKLSSPYSW